VFCVLFIVRALPCPAVVAWENRPWSWLRFKGPLGYILKLNKSACVSVGRFWSIDLNLAVYACVPVSSHHHHHNDPWAASATAGTDGDLNNDFDDGLGSQLPQGQTGMAAVDSQVDIYTYSFHQFLPVAPKASAPLYYWSCNHGQGQ